VRIGVTGHMDLTDDTIPLVAYALHETLKPYADGNLTGVSCLARGADSIFAQVIINLGGKLEIVLPSTNYRETKVKPDHAPLFDQLLTQATTVRTMPFDTAGRDAYVAANEAVLDSIDQLVAVWDGQPSTDRGGTADNVDDAHRRNLPVAVIWPVGAARSE
jgi:hypothetical protein